MKVSQHGQVTIPRKIRERFGIGPETNVEFLVHGSRIVLKKAPNKLNLAKWKGRCRGSFRELGYTSVDKYLVIPPWTSTRKMFAEDGHASDTTVLLDLLLPNEAFVRRSTIAVEQATTEGLLVICDLV